MKHLRTAISLLLILSLLPICGFAAEAPASNEDIIYLDDGSYIVVEDFSIDTRATSFKSGGKSYTLYSNNGEAQWKATLSATYAYNGNISTCSDASLDVEIYDTAWYEISQKTTHAGDTAQAELTMGKKFLGIKIDEETINITLTCDKNGNLS